MRRIALAASLLCFAAMCLACGGAGVGVTEKAAPARDRADVIAAYTARIEPARKERTVKLEAEIAEATQAITKSKADVETAKKALRAASGAKAKEAAQRKLEEAESALRNATSAKERAAKSLAGVATWLPRTNPHELKPGEVTRFCTDDEHTPVFTVFQRVDASNILVKFGEEIFWVEGVSTLSADEGKQVEFLGVIECTGTKEYLSALGTRQAVRSFRHYRD